MDNLTISEGNQQKRIPTEREQERLRCRKIVQELRDYYSKRLENADNSIDEQRCICHVELCDSILNSFQLL